MSDIVTTWMDGHELKTEYDIEYITDRKNWEIVCSDKHPAPWELYEHKVMEDFSDAMAWYFIALFAEHIFDVKMMESTYIDGKLVRERSFVLPSDFTYYLQQNINREMRKENERMHEQHKEDSAWIADATEFLGKYNMKKFEEYRNNKANSDFT